MPSINKRTYVRHDQDIQDVLIFAAPDHRVAMSVIATWTDEQCFEARKWADIVQSRKRNKYKSRTPLPEMPAHIATCPRHLF